jgi:helix-turn-helix protein
MSVQAISWAMEVECPSSTAKLVLICLANYSDSEGVSFPGQETIAKNAGVTSRTVRRALLELEGANLICRGHRQRANGSRTSDFYQLKSNRSGCPVDTENEVIQPDKIGRSNRTPMSTPIEEPLEEPKEKGLSNESPKKPDHETAFEMWNEFAQEHSISKAQILTKARISKIKSRLKTCGGLEGWAAAISLVGKSTYLLGSNDRGWTASLDFVLQESSFIKLIEGNYTDRPSAKQRGSPYGQRDTAANAAAQMLQEMEEDDRENERQQKTVGDDNQPPLGLIPARA